jgi:hypothetical protein
MTAALQTQNHIMKLNQNTLSMPGIIATQDKSPLASIPALLATLTGAVLLTCSTPTAKAQGVIFTEPFSTGASGWANNASSPAIWATIGGVTGDGDGYITGTVAAGTNSTYVVLRDQSSLAGSYTGLFGNWTTTGASPLSVATLSFDLYQDSGTAQDFGLRFTTAAGFPGAFLGGKISLGSDVWTHFDIAVDSSAGFTFPEGGGSYGSILSSLARVQFTVDQATASSFNVRLDNVTISTAPVPEPATFALAGMGLTLFAVMARRMKRNA